MRCLFCKQDSTSSRSVEHIIPESLGNTTLILPVGVVCDRCNNYFANKLERPFLESQAIHQLRFNQAIRNKRGRFPHISGTLAPEFPAVIYRDSKTGIPFISVESTAFEYMLSAGSGMLIVPGSSQMNQDIVTSRFLAKVALEAMAHRLRFHPDGLEYLVDEKQLDLIRDYARKGGAIVWPLSIRTLYDANKKWVDDKGEEAQLVHETDILHTPQGEMYFVLAVFGVEMVINYGGPEITGYQRWLNENNDASPLYTGKNVESSRLRAADE